ncbi:MAG: hypothetical protein AAGC43_00300 [Bacteroidota bacterium]
MIDEDLWDSEFEAYSITKDLYSRAIDSNKNEIIEKVEYEELKIEY